MNTVPRYSAPLDRALQLTASATVFEVSFGGVPTPDSITFSAMLLGAVGNISFSSEPAVPLAVANGNAVLKFSDMTPSVVTVTASALIEGVPYIDRQTVEKRQALDLRPPPAPTGLAVTGTAATIVLHWDAAPAAYINLSHTEVWRATVNNLAQATLAGRAEGREYIDPVGPGATRYYWIRYVSRASIPGPYNANGGTVGASDVEVEHLLDVLTGEITKGQLHADLGQKIDLIDELDEAYGDTASAAVSAATATEAAAAALLSQQQAATAAGQGGQYASQASQSATSAGTDAGRATTSAGQASQSATGAAGSASAAQSSASTAAQAAQSASGSAAAAVTSAQNASGFATAAETASTASTASKVAAEAARTGASGSAQAASGSAGTATAKATEASQSAAAAASSAVTAGTKASDAGVYASQAASSKTAADGSAQAAATFLQQAQAILLDPVTGLVDKYAAVKVLADATASSLNGVRARYGVQLDADGVAGGFELLAGGGRLDFGVRASTFFVASPAGSGIASAVPFIVRTTETIVDGVTIPIGMYITNAFIQNAAITNAKIGGDIWSSNFVIGQAGWRLYRSGDMEINNLRARGRLMGGDFGGYAWPPSGGGFYLGPEGLLLGNPATGKYIELGSDGYVGMPGFVISGGRAKFSGDVVTGSAPAFRIEMGPDDPVYAMWAGSGAKTDANAIFFLKRNGAGYFGGALTGGVLRTSVTNPTVDPAAQVIDGPFGSNGGTITVVGSIDWTSQRSSLNHFFTAGAGATQAVLRLYRKIGTGSEALVHTATVPGNLAIANAEPSDEISSATLSTSGSFTYTDPVTSSVDRTYRLEVAITSQTVSTAIKPGAGGTSFRPATASQRLTIITSE